MEPVGRFEERMQLAAQDEKGRGSIAAALRLMRSFDRDAADLDAELGAVGVHDRDLRGKLEGYRAAVRAVGRSSAGSASVLSAAAESMAPTLATATVAAEELDRACVRPDAACKALEPILQGSGAGASVLDDGPELLLQAVGRIRDVHAKRAKVAAAQEQLAGAIEALAHSLAETERASTAEGHALELTGAMWKSAGAALHQYCAATPGGARSSEWVTASSSGDVRALTVVVSFKPPGSLTGDFERAAANAPQGEGGFYRAAAAGGFGSGFVLVRHAGSDSKAFVVTNRHVVELADHVEVTRDEGGSSRARIVYTDPHYDLAVLALEGAGPTFDHGFDLDTGGVKDEEAVVATGYPGLANHPSYQVTKGYVSNDRFELDSGDLKLPYIQHTAAIDRGSSGGPLLGEGGKVLGVNTLKAFGREGVAFAVPAAAVAGAVRYAAGLDAQLAQVSFRRQTLRDDCLDLVAELLQKEPRIERLEKLVSTRLIAEEGGDAYDAVVDGNDELAKRWEDDPVEAFRMAIALRLKDDVRRAGGVAATETCAAPNMLDYGNILTVDRVRVPIRVGVTSAELSMRWEQGRWKLAKVDFRGQSGARGGARSVR
jgi:serine protease Do